MTNSIDSVLKKAAIASAISMTVAGGAQAAFTALPGNTSFRLEIVAGCFDFGNCLVTTPGPGNPGSKVEDNTAAQTTVTGTTLNSGGAIVTVGSGIAGDGIMGIITFETDATGLNLSVTSFAQDSYINTAGGTFALQDTGGGAAMSGTFDASGNMTLQTTGRTGLAATFTAALGEQIWNKDDSTNPDMEDLGSVTNAWDVWTTGSSANRTTGVNPGFTLTGIPLDDASPGAWSGRVVSAGNIGDAWGFFSGTPYSEVFDVTITALPNPVAVDDTAVTVAATAVSIDVLANDNDPQGGALTINSIDTTGLAAGSSAVINAGQILYTPGPGVLGTEAFTYIASSAGGLSSPATVSVNVTVAGNTPPVAVDDPYVTDEDVVGTTVDVTLNDFDADGDTLTVIANTGPASGSVVDNGDNTFTYTPNANFNGTDTFVYTIDDGNGGQDSANVNITVNPVNDPPIANDVTVTTALDTPVDIDVLANDSDPDNDPLTIQSFTQPSNGAVVDNGDDTLKYTPNTGYAGADQFTYVVSDGNGGTDSATVFITVIAVSFTSPVAPNDPGNQISPDITGGSNFTMINPSGSDIGGTNDLGAGWDGTIYTDENTQTVANMSIATTTPTPFFGFVWEATTVRVFGPGTYTFDTCPGTLTDSGGVLGWIAPDGSTNCNPPPEANDLSMTVGPNQLGAHMLFNWNLTKNIDVVMVWDINAVWTGAPDGSNNFAVAGAVFNLSVIDDDGDGTNGHPMADGPFKNFNANFNLNLNPVFGASVVTASASQSGRNTAVVVPADGNVTVTAATTGGNVVYDWSASDPALLNVASGGTSGSSLVFDPATLPNGAVTARITVTDNNQDGLQNSTEIALRVDSAETLADAADDTGNGIPNAEDLGDPTLLQGDPVNSSLFRLQTSAGQLKLGVLAANNGAAGGGYGAMVSAGDIGTNDDGVTNSCVGGCFSFEVVGISNGSSASVVLPQVNPLPDDAVYRLFVNDQWRNFRETGTASGSAPGGTLASAPGSPGLCPSPGDSAYTPGLTAGDLCVQVTLNDGGLNDADGTINGRIVDPSGVGGGVVTQSAVISSISSPSTGGGCSLGAIPVDPLRRSDWWLIVGAIGLLGWVSGSRRRRKAE